MKKIFLIYLLAVTDIAYADSVISDIGDKVLSASGITPVNPALVLAPGTYLNISGKLGGTVVKVFGNDPCPKDWKGLSLGNGCSVLDKPVVTVHYLLDGETVTERWKVYKSGVRTSLVRPDGTIVSQAQ